MIYSSGAQTGTLGFLDVNVLDATGGNVEKAQGWCGMYFDENGNGKYDEGVDQKVTVMGSYGVAANPKGSQCVGSRSRRSGQDRARRSSHLRDGNL